MSTELNVEQTAAIQLVHSRRFGALGALTPDGHPYVAMAAYLAISESTDVTLFLSRLSDQRRFLEADGRASLMVESADVPAEKKLASPRITLLGEVTPIERSDELRAHWLERHPESELWIDFADFGFFRLSCQKARYIEGFGSMSRLTFK